MSGTLTEHVESKIIKTTLHIKNFSSDELKLIDTYCKKKYDNNRRQMILDLIRQDEHDIFHQIIDDKMMLIYDNLNKRIESLEDFKTTINKVYKEAHANKIKEAAQPPVKPTWKGFKSK